ncbi:endonuclease [Lacinutrix sp. MedPE-SW]|uniref:endonuclease n=1 Tax=Lacinutrix sp. MedPE-SW TaxID=1860087 RepID=UPI0009166DBA|nr:endonuclease [Lacinutrix sp. MedPE-SW]OIQ19449.1 MAG: endonuclease I [Lacinutrix sp. MedPE-SW]
MKKNIIFSAILLFCNLIFSQQVVINELDCDNPGLDEEEFVELLTATPNMSLDGFVMVFFNGSSSGGDSSYFAVDLTGSVSDDNGLLLIGSTTVMPFPQLLIPSNVIQNGADAVAIYQDSIDAFPGETLATTTNLVDALVYSTNDAVDTNLLSLLGLGPNDQVSEGAGNNSNSIQRFDDGSGTITYTATTPTPRALNDGSGIVFNAIEISTTQEIYNEGDTIPITFTSQSNVNQDATFSFTLDNESFTTSDFTGNTTVTIPSGQNSVTTSITVLSDGINDGDEEPIVKFVNLSTPYIPFNNFLKLRVVDNDFMVAPFNAPIPGNPPMPTGVVQSTQPAGYYDSLNGLSGANLEQAIQDIIAEEGVVRAQTYADVIDILKEADQNPENSNQVWLVYTEQGRAKLDYQTTSNSVGKWNREHTFPRSLAGYNSIDEDDDADGIDVFWNTTADSLRHGNSDAHALRAADGPENSSRGNQHYGEYNGPTGNQSSFKGDVARSVLYMQLRYNGLEIVNGFPTTTGQMGDLATLLQWHNQDPPDDFEMNRNNVIYNWQFNRNPLIDMPDLVDYIWGANAGEVWNNSLSVESFNTEILKIFPNPVSNQLFISGKEDEYLVAIYSSEGRKIKSETIYNNSSIKLNLASGLYFAQITANDKTETRKFLVK